MGIYKRVLRKVGTWAVLGGLGAGGVWLATMADGPRASGQAPAPGAAREVQKKKIYTNKTVFHLPVQMDPRTRGQLREVCLYLKAGSADWVRQETGQPNTTHFTYNAPRDGEYWFSVVTIDKNGRATPADVAMEAPGLVVVVDTQEPVLELQPVSAAGETLLRCSMQDPHPDLSSVKLVYRGNDQIDHIVEPLPNRPGYFRVPVEAWNRPVLVKGSDRCGNAAVREFQLRNPHVARPSGSGTPERQSEEPPLSSVPENVIAAASKNEPPSSIKPPTREPGPRTVDSHEPPPLTPPSPFPSTVKPSTLPPPLPITSGPDLTSTKVFGPNNAGGPRQLLNTTKAALEYRIDQVGPSGVGKVEVFTTHDGGSTWQRLVDDADRRSPAEIHLPGEGVFGIKLIVTNGNGFGGTPPKQGETPGSFIEVDTTAPSVQLRDIEPQSKEGCLEIRWKATDKNLGAEPVNLYYRVRHDAAWVPIAKKIRNEGIYMWSFPRDSGNRFFVKIEVADQAGNIARVECPNPVVLDMTEPRASVVGISGMVRPTAHDD